MTPLRTGGGKALRGSCGRGSEAGSEPKPAFAIAARADYFGDAPCSDFDLAAEFDDAVGREAKELGCVESGVRHRDKQLLAPAEQAG